MAEKVETELALFFERLFSSYISQAGGGASLALYRNKVRMLAKTRPSLGALAIDDSGKVSVTIDGAKAKGCAEDLCHAFNSLVEVSAFTVGQRIAYEGAASIASSILKQFSGTSFEHCIKACLLNGYLAERMPLGVPGEQAMLPEGVPKRSTTTVESPAGSERELLLLALVRSELERGGSVVAILGNRTPQELRNGLAETGLRCAHYEQRGTFKIVDWFSHRERVVHGVEQDPMGSIFCSLDLTSLGLGVERALGQIDFAPSLRVVSDMVSPSINTHGPAKTYEFVQKISGAVKGKGGMTFWAFDPKGVEPKTLSSLRQLADCVLELRRHEGEKGIGRTLEVVSLRGARSSKGQFQLLLTKGGLQITEGELDESSALAELQTVPGVGAAVARALYDAGFHSLEKMEKAGKEEMAKAIGDDAATAVHDYLHSVEYAKRMLAERSRSWVEKGKRSSAEGNMKGAVDNFKRALEIFEDNAEAWYELGHLLYDGGMVDDAKDCFMKALKLDAVYDGEWYGDASEIDSVYACPTCGVAVESEEVRCPGCGVLFTMEERRRLKEKLGGR